MKENPNIYGIKTIAAIMTVSWWLLFGLGCAALFVVVTAIAWFLPAFMGLGLKLIGVILIGGVIFNIIMVIAALMRREVIPFIKTRLIWMKYVVPVARSIAKRTWLDPDKTVWSFITLSNQFILNSLKNTPVTNLMILLPHCLQRQSCGLKLTSDIRNCKKCGKCVVHKLIELSDTLSVHISVASGGTMARKQIMVQRPSVVLAVACERDLLSGIRDTLPLPVVGVINERPEGPCVNTTVDITQLAAVINHIKEK